MKPTTLEAYKLLHDGSIALARMEANGIRIDMDRLKSNMTTVSGKIKDLEEAIKQDEVYKAWKKAYGDKFNMASIPQLGKVLFTHMKYECKERTPTGRPKVDESTLESLNIPFTKKFLYIQKLKKLLNTYLKGIEREAVDGLVHPSYSLNRVDTYRSSASQPSFQNIPVRKPEFAKLIRQCYIPRDGHVLVETDYSGIEVRVSACYNKDPVLIEYINDKSKDMHRDMAAQCYKLDPKSVQKQPRYCAKNMFVFPQFYGDYYIDCAIHLWEAIDRLHLVDEHGVSLRTSLEEQGITELGVCDPKQRPRSGTFEAHIKAVEEDFWGRRFKVYNEWKNQWWRGYLRTGGIDFLTGFRIEGIYKRNDILNYGTQGSAFHCDLWSIIEIQRLLYKYKMKTKLVGEIHDSILADSPVKEVQNYLEIAHKVMTKDIRKAWKWIIVPLEFEAEVTPEKASWNDKQPWQCKNGVWSLAV